MKINKITIRNFKVFKELTVTFDSQDLIVFDGPNGFGKTSIYDAIELLFTGQIRRYVVLDSLIVDGRESHDEHPFYNEGATGDIVITIQFTKDDTTYVLERVALESEISNGIDFSIYKLYEKEVFDAVERIVIDDEKTFLSEILGKDYKENFQFLNYVEQEDTLFLLKNKDNNRKQHISHLFNVTEFENQVTILNRLKQKIDELCSKEEEASIKEIEQDIKQVSDFLASGYAAEEYTQLFPGKEISWDTEDYDFQQFGYTTLFDDAGILPRLAGLIGYRDDFTGFLRNEAIDALIGNRAALEDFLKFSRHMPQKNELIQQKESYRSAVNLRTILMDFSLDDLKFDLQLSLEKYPNYIPDADKEKLGEGIGYLKNSMNELNKLESIYTGINESRQKLIENITLLKNEVPDASGACLLCGYQWSDLEEQLTNIQLQSDVLERLTSDKAAHFMLSIEDFKTETLAPIISLINGSLKDITVDVDFVNKLLEFDEISFSTIVRNFEKISFSYDSYRNALAKIPDNTKIEELVKALQQQRIEVNYTNVGPHFKEDFSFYFDGGLEKLLQFDSAAIAKKSAYLKYLYSLQQNEYLNEKKAQLETRNKKYLNAKSLSDRLKGLKKTYDDSLKKYQQKVIKDIEIVFHIYSGRIMQNFHGGLGLFIFSDRNGIRFQTNPSKTFDALFSMSSGQLSALIISFTLALHKKYSQNKLILIDDPVQTMDELNVMGFVELMRNEFKGNQILISTHEDMMSSFIRYKFEAYNLNHNRINLKLMEY